MSGSCKELCWDEWGAHFQGNILSHHSEPTVSQAGGERGLEKEKNYLRQSEGHQRSDHHHKVQDVPQVSEVGAILQDQALVYHLQGKDRHW